MLNRIRYTLHNALLRFKNRTKRILFLESLLFSGVFGIAFHFWLVGEV